MKFCRDAQAQTIAPDDWNVLMSQRRRWINSTVHNLAELLFIDRLCGFCCFSMRFIVFIGAFTPLSSHCPLLTPASADLLSTLIAPVTVAYIGYVSSHLLRPRDRGTDARPSPSSSTSSLLSTRPSPRRLSSCSEPSTVSRRSSTSCTESSSTSVSPVSSLAFRGNTDACVLGWMIVYILAIPLFSFVLPLASFWQMDDFSWYVSPPLFPLADTDVRMSTGDLLVRSSESVDAVSSFTTRASSTPLLSLSRAGTTSRTSAYPPLSAVDRELTRVVVDYGNKDRIRVSDLSSTLRSARIPTLATATSRCTNLPFPVATAPSRLAAA